MQETWLFYVLLHIFQNESKKKTQNNHEQEKYTVKYIFL